jgi:hypothetical protein
MTTSRTAISDLERIRTAMQADTGGYADYWDPQPGDMLCGTVLSFSVGQTKVGERRVCTVSDIDTGKQVAIWLSRSMLQSLFEEQHPQVGDTICVKYHGVRQPKRAGGSGYHALQVVRSTSNRPTQTPDGPDDGGGPPIVWDDLEADLPF